MKNIRIYPYKMSSKSSAQLAKALRELGAKVLRVYPDRRYNPKDNDLIINWGASRHPNWNGDMLNPPDKIELSSNKLKTLVALTENGVDTLEFTTSPEIARSWATDTKVYCRTLLSSCSGKGIVVATTPEKIVQAPLYTKQFNKTNEYRVHVWGGEVLNLQEKVRKQGFGRRVGEDVWNHDNNFVFARQNLTVPDMVKSVSIDAVISLGLDFGAVDVGYDQASNTCKVFEVNTAPGLVNTTLKNYAEKIYELSAR